MNLNYMHWVNKLPEVGDPILNERDRVASLLAEAEELEKRAASLRAVVKAGRANLIRRISERWSLGDIERASAASIKEPASLLANVRDEYLRAALIGLDGGGSAVELLHVFKQCGFDNQARLLTASSTDEVRSLLFRLLDWWNFGVFPLLVRFDQ